MTNQHSLGLRKQMLEDRIDRISADLEVSKDKAFMHLAYALLFNTPYYDSDFSLDVVDGGDDKQIDIIRIDEDSDQAIIHIIQIKNAETYSSNVVVQMRDALSWCFERSQEQYTTLISNKDLVLKINDIRRLSAKYGLRNLSVYVHYVAKGDTERLSPNFEKEVSLTENQYAGSREFREFKFKVWGVRELVDRLYEIEEQKRRINLDISVYKVWEYPTYLKYNSGKIDAIICTVDGSEIASIVNQYGKHLFEENVRTYLGGKKAVNDEIFKSCGNDEEAEYFWFFNNGITVTCDHFDMVPNVTPAILKISNIQIVNGCQTSMTLKEAADDKKLNPKTKVLFKVFATQDKIFVEKITLTTNSQNAVSNRDLSSNDQLQRHLEDLFRARGYYYERKPGMFKELSKKEREKVISNEKVGQAYLAVAMHAPATAMARSNKIWSGDLYKKIFNSSVEEMLASYLIFNYCLNKSKEEGKNLEGADKAITKYGNFHLACLIGALRISKSWKQHSIQQILTDFIKEIEQDTVSLDLYYFQAQENLKQVVEKLYDSDTSKLINVFKSEKINQELDNLIKTLGNT